MCTGVEVALIASAVVGAGTAVYSGQQQKKAADVQGELLDRQAAQEKDAAMAEADRLRKATKYKRGQARAALAASGVDVDASATATLIDDTIVANDEQDAFNLLLTGGRRASSLNAEAGLSRAQGSAAQTAGYLNAGSTLLGSYGDYNLRKAGYQRTGG